MSNFYKKLNITAKNTDAYLKNFFLNKNKNNSYLIKPMKYGVFSGGKRFRSNILINTGKIFGADYKKLIIVGAAIECIHAYSLMHDDLPAMDNDDLRRGKLSVHKKFNEFTAILSGNSLLTLAFEILSSTNLKLNQKNKNELIKALSKKFTLNVVYDYNKLDFTPTPGSSFEAAFNTPEHNLKAGLLGNFDKLSFNISSRYTSEYYYEASFVDGMIDARTVIDAQVSYQIPSLKAILKVGGNNLGGKEYQSVLGGGRIGSIYYTSLSFDF